MLLQLVWSSRRALGSLLACASALGLAGCSSANEAEEEALELQFEARFAGKAIDCEGSIPALGTSEVPAKPLDFRFFLHNIELVRAGGERVPLDLTNDGVWQRDGVALLDFEDGSGSCETGSRETNRSLRGAAKAHDDYTGIAFTLGIPEDMNHLDAATAPAPFNAPGMWWSWQGGYKYARIDVVTDDHPGGYFFHLGGTNCEGTPSDGFACQYGNLAQVELSARGLGPIVLDGAALYRDLDLAQQPDSQSDFVPGCMAFSGDPECPAMFSAVGLAFEDAKERPPEQTAFELEGTK